MFHSFLLLRERKFAKKSLLNQKKKNFFSKNIHPESKTNGGAND